MVQVRYGHCAALHAAGIVNLWRLNNSSRARTRATEHNSNRKPTHSRSDKVVSHRHIRFRAVNDSRQWKVAQSVTRILLDQRKS